MSILSLIMPEINHSKVPRTNKTWRERSIFSKKIAHKIWKRCKNNWLLNCKNWSGKINYHRNGQMYVCKYFLWLVYAVRIFILSLNLCIDEIMFICLFDSLPPIMVQIIDPTLFFPHIPIKMCHFLVSNRILKLE